MERKELVVLAHGFFRTKHNMEFLRRGLSDRGHNVLSIRLPTTLGDLEACCRAMDRQLAQVLSEYGTVSFVGYSMGALATRFYLREHARGKVRRCVFIAPPHGGSAIADFLDRIPLYSSVFRPIREFRTGCEESLFLLPRPIDVGVIAGSRNTMLGGILFLSKASDGRVEIESTRCPDMKELLILPYNHLKINHNIETLEAVDRFLKNGTFSP